MLLDDLLIGFEQAGEKVKSFCPRYNIIKLDDGYKLEVAVPGVNKSDLTVELVDGELLIQVASSKPQDEENALEYLVKGISSKNFAQKFKLNKSLEVAKATLNQGLLSVRLTKKQNICKTVEVEDEG